MSEKSRIGILILILVVAALVSVAISVNMLYQTALELTGKHLLEIARSQARLIEAIARFDKEYTSEYAGGSLEATLSQVIESHKNYERFGETGDITLARREDDKIIFLLSHQQDGIVEIRPPVLFYSKIAEPQRRAISGQSGTMIGLDYRGEVVLAAYDHVDELDIGIVVKIDIAEVRAPYIDAGIKAGITALFLVSFGSFFALRMSNPIIQKITEYSENLEDSVIERTHEMVEAYLTLQQLNKRLVEGQEYERQHVSHELHDEIAQFLVGLKFSIGAALELPSGERKTKFESFQNEIDFILGGVRKLSSELHPTSIGSFGLKAALLSYFQRFTKKTQIEIGFLENGLDNRILPNLEITVYRIIQDVLTNADRYVNMTEVKVDIQRGNDLIEIIIHYNSEGVSSEFIEDYNKSLSVASIRERVLMFDGEFAITVDSGLGTRIDIKFPVR